MATNPLRDFMAVQRRRIPQPGPAIDVAKLGSDLRVSAREAGATPKPKGVAAPPADYELHLS